MSPRQPKLLCLAISLAMLTLTTAACGEALEEQAPQESRAFALDQGDMPQPDPFLPKTQLSPTAHTSATISASTAQWHLMATRFGIVR